MRIAVTGATGNVGTSVLGALGTLPEVDEIIGIARRSPDAALPKVTWKAVDVSNGDLSSAFSGVDAVIHLAWRLQPSHDRDQQRATNVNGSRRVFEAAVKAGVKAMVVASSVGAYSPGPKTPTDESSPTDGVPTSTYSVDKAEVERLIDLYERAHPDIRWVRMRPGLIFKRESGPEIKRLFLGALVPVQLLPKPEFPVVPDIDGLAFQAVHASDVGTAFARAAVRNVRGAFNIAAEPVLTPDVLATTLKARTVKVPVALVRGAIDASWRARLQPTEPGWLDLALQTPLLDTSRAQRELDWTPTISSTDALLEVFDGMISGSGFLTPPLHSSPTNPLKRFASAFRQHLKR